MKYHINGQGEVKNCTATKEKCPFGGETGNENHFLSKKEAEIELQSRLKDTYGHLQGVMRKETKNSFDKDKEKISDLLLKINIFNKNNLPQVHNSSDIVKNWFNGNKNQYNFIKKLAYNDKPISKETRVSIKKLLKKSFSLDFENTDDNSYIKNDLLKESTVSFIDDSPNNIVNIEDLRKSDFNIFNS